MANIVTGGADTFEQSEITQFRLLREGKRFVVGDNKGNMKTFAYSDGKVESVNEKHGQEITSIRYDARNSLIISAGWDSKIIVQKETRDDQVNLVRLVENAHFG